MYYLPVNSRQRHETLSIDLPGVVAADTLNSSLTDLTPVLFLLGALLKEVCHELCSCLAMVWINVEATLVLLDDLNWTALICCKGACHGLHTRTGMQ